MAIGRATLRRRGNDVTIATHSYMCRVADAAADRLAGEGISCEIVDLRSLAPLDVATVAASVARTGTLVTLEEGQLACGIGAEVAFRVRDEVGTMRVARVGADARAGLGQPRTRGREPAGSADVVVAAVRRLLRS